MEENELHLCWMESSPRKRGFSVRNTVARLSVTRKLDSQGDEERLKTVLGWTTLAVGVCGLECKGEEVSLLS